MGQSAQTQDMFSVPSGGIADFYMSDEDIAAVEREEAQKTLVTKGLQPLRTLPRRWPLTVVLAMTASFTLKAARSVVPRALIEQSPELKESIFSHLREQGVEDPERYVVGSFCKQPEP